MTTTTPPCNWSTRSAHGHWNDQSGQSPDKIPLYPKYDVTWESLCSRNAAAYRVLIFYTWSYLWGKVGDSGPCCTQCSHKWQKNTDHQQPDGATARVYSGEFSPVALMWNHSPDFIPRASTLLLRLTFWLDHTLDSPAFASCSIHQGLGGRVLIYGPRKEDTVPAEGTSKEPRVCYTRHPQAQAPEVSILSVQLKFLQNLFTKFINFLRILSKFLVSNYFISFLDAEKNAINIFGMSQKAFNKTGENKPSIKRSVSLDNIPSTSHS